MIRNKTNLDALIELGKHVQLTFELHKKMEAYRNASALSKLGAYILAMKKIESYKAISSIPEIKDSIPEPSSFSYSTYDLFSPPSVSENKTVKNIVIDETSRVKRIITDIYNDNSVLLKLKPRDFEEMIAELLNAQGFSVELTKQTRDNGFDIIAIKYMNTHSPVKFLVECKRFTTRKVGVEIIRSFKEVIQTERANRGIIVTTSYFSSQATKKQKEIPYLLDFRDKDNVLEWVNQYKKEITAS